MSGLSVHIEQLEPLHVCTISITSETPEGEAIDALLDWARPQGLLAGSYRFFGYDNCQPHPNHRYTTLLTVDKDIQQSGDVEIMDVPGGQYAVTEVRGVEQIGPAWRQLENWVKESGYAFGDQPGLEEYIDKPGERPLNDSRFRLYLAIRD